MAIEQRIAKSAALTLNPDPHNQTLEVVNRIVAQVLGMAGCSHCGRLAHLRIDLVSDPPAELAKAGVISFERQGF